MTARPSSPALLAAMLAALAAFVPATPAPAQVTSAPMTAPNAFPGAYRASRKGADSMQVLTLSLGRDGSARMITSYPGYTMTAAGTRIYPYVETGTWRPDQGLARVRFTQSGQLVAARVTNLRPEASEAWFKISGCRLRVTRDPQRTFGTMGITFAKLDCRG